MSIPRVCPLIAAGNPVHLSKCREGGCAWWTGACCVVQQKKSLPDATNTEQARGGTEFADTVSTSNDTKETEDLQA